MKLTTFEEWLATLLGQSAHDVRQLLANETAVQFLITWSIFEAKQFDGYMKMEKIDPFCERIVSQKFNMTPIDDIARYFHDRYGNDDLYQQLMHKQKSPQMKALLQKDFDSLPDDKRIFI